MSSHFMYYNVPLLLYIALYNRKWKAFFLHLLSRTYDNRCLDDVPASFSHTLSALEIGQSTVTFCLRIHSSVIS